MLEDYNLPQTDNDPDLIFQLDSAPRYFGCIIHERGVTLTTHPILCRG
jgi:hypothetical protein